MNNTYGVVKPSVINPANDVEIWYHYRPSRSNMDSNFGSFKRLSDVDVSELFKNATINEDDEDKNGEDNLLSGMYNLSLPASIFSSVGFYTVYIKPREIICKIKDIGSLAAYPDVTGIVVDLNDVNSSNRNLFKNDNLSGYRIEYFEPSTEKGNLKRQEYYRLVTSCNLCEVMSLNLTSSNTSANAYRFNESANLSFLTVTPSTSPSFKSTQKPFIGSPDQQISIINTKFDPVCIEIEICKNDFDTLTTVLTGNQVRSLDNGIVTTYNENGEIFNQYEFYTLKDNYNTRDMYEVKRNRTDNIDLTAPYEEIINA